MRAWRWTNGLMIAGVVLNAAGLGALAHVAGHPAVSAGAIGAAIAAATWAAVAAYRATIAPIMAQRLSSDGRLPDWYAAVADLASALVLLYIVIGSWSHALVGSGLLRGQETTAWVGWFALGFGLLGGASQLPPLSRVAGLRGFFQVVALVQLPTLIIGIAVLLRP